MLVTKSFIAEHLPTGDKKTTPQYCYRTNEKFIRYCIVQEIVVVRLAVCIVLVLTLNFEVGKIAQMQLPEK